LPKDGNMKDFICPEIKNKNRQKLPTFYRLNGAIYIAYIKYLKDRNSFFNEKSYAYIMPKEKSIDIDNEIDFKLAELLMANRHNEK